MTNDKKAEMGSHYLFGNDLEQSIFKIEIIKPREHEIHFS